ncbi:MAG: hypothetical protein ACFFBR_02515 [Promethearchaeota archaeon]
MPEEAKDHVVDNLVHCAISLSAYNMVTDLNIKLSLIQQINKEYNALANKLESGNISQQDLDVAAPVAKEKVSPEIRRRDDFGLHAEATDKLANSAPSRVDQIINFLKQNRKLEILATLSFKEPAE